MRQSAIVVLEDSVAVDALHEIARSNGWTCTADIPRTHLIMASVRWLTQEGVEVSHYEDHVSDVRYLRVEGPGAAAVAGQLRRGVRSDSLDELLTAAARATDPAECVRALSRLSVVAPDTDDERFVVIWRDKLCHPDRAVRRAATRTAYTCRWPSMKEVVKERIERDHHLRPLLEDLLAFYD